MKMTIVEKILARASGREKVSPGEYVTAKIDVAMMPENFRLLRSILKQAGISEEEFRLWDPERLVVVSITGSPLRNSPRPRIRSSAGTWPESSG